jgi:hypothetical protein
VTPAKAGDEGVEVGDVLVKITEKTQFPGFRFFGRVEFGPWQKQEKTPSRLILHETRLEDQELGACDMLCPIQKPKWKSR